MWKLFHKCFGWDYVYVQSINIKKIVRVSVAPNGHRLFITYGHQVNIISEPLSAKGSIVGEWFVIPLTPNVTINEGKSE